MFSFSNSIQSYKSLPYPALLLLIVFNYNGFNYTSSIVKLEPSIKFPIEFSMSSDKI